MESKYVIKIQGQVDELFHGVTEDGKPFSVKILSKTLFDIKEKKGVGYENGIPAWIDDNKPDPTLYGDECILSPMTNSSSEVKIKPPQKDELWIVTIKN